MLSILYHDKISNYLVDSLFAPIKLFTHKNLEFLIEDDDSWIDLVEILKNMKENRIRGLFNQSGYLTVDAKSKILDKILRRHKKDFPSQISFFEMENYRLKELKKQKEKTYNSIGVKEDEKEFIEKEVKRLTINPITTIEEFNEIFEKIPQPKVKISIIKELYSDNDSSKLVGIIKNSENREKSLETIFKHLPISNKESDSEQQVTRDLISSHLRNSLEKELYGARSELNTEEKGSRSSFKR